MQSDKEAIERFLSFYLHEEYSDAKEWAKKQESEKPFFRFVELFFTALETVESSYRYDDATKIFTQIAHDLENKQCIFDASLFASLCRVEIDRLKIDKAIYTQNDIRLHNAAQSMRKHVENGLSFVKNASLQKEQTITLKERLQAYSSFAQGMEIVAKLYLNRWEHTQKDEYATMKERVLAYVEELRKNEHFILAYDLKAHLFTLDKFYEEGEKRELYIENGTIELNYYAVVDTKTQEWLEERLLQDTKGSLELFGAEPIELVMEDIWSDLKFKYFITHHIWELDECVLEDFFKNSQRVVFDVTLHYYTMGVFIVNFSLPLERLGENGASVTQYRALLGLGENFALSERFTFAKKEFSFLQEVAKFVFDSLEERLKNENPTCQNPLFFDEIDFSPFVISNLYEFSYRAKNGNVAIYGMETLKQLESYSGIVSEVKEVRTSIDNWLMYEVEEFENLASIRYFEDEVIKIDLGQALLVLPKEAEWVRTQAVDSVFMAMAVFNLLDLNANKYILRLEHLLDYKAAKKRQMEEESCEDELAYIDKQKAWLERIVEIMDNGLMTQFPDHTRFMEAVYNRLNLKKSKEKTMNAVAVYKKHQEKRSLKRFRFLFLAATAFVSASALSDIFGILNHIEKHMIPPVLQLVIIVAFVAIFIYYSSKNEDLKDE